jgi:hypothetical protein
MAEDAYLKCQREYFVQISKHSAGVPEKTVNKIIEEYNKFIVKGLIDESPYVAEDLKLTILKAREMNGPEQES